ncbi:hypothetical protein J5N97_003784 [Dioscorea zingiberensis]|uniref:Non-specific lipid-transfer protein n=1 Tax=Dioscorea zingiberensis TaxID=325984 RepID=A0A9D5HQU4_9LILI|nr:hypothetical protein J5N97_003784 [Dioscorea zingiberensis]
MASLKVKVFMVGLMVVCMAMEWQRGEALACGTVASSLGPCFPYVRGQVTTVPPGCCAGVKSLNSQANTTPARQQVCVCLQSLAKSVSGVNMGLASGLPGKCGVSVGYPISTSVDCSKVQ